MNLRRTSLGIVLLLCLVLRATAQAPATCTVTGTLLKADGSGPVSGVSLRITPVSVNGILLSAQSFTTAPSDNNGLITFTIIQGIRVRISGPALPYTGQGLTVI